MSQRCCKNTARMRSIGQEAGSPEIVGIQIPIRFRMMDELVKKIDKLR